MFSTQFSLADIFNDSLFLTWCPLGQTDPYRKKYKRKKMPVHQREALKDMSKKERIIFLIKHNKLEELKALDMLLTLNPSIIARHSQ